MNQTFVYKLLLGQLSLLLGLSIFPFISLGMIPGTSYFLVLIPSLIALTLNRKKFISFICLLNLLFLTFLLIDTSHYFIYGNLPSPGIFIAIFETHMNEAIEFLESQDLVPVLSFLVLVSALSFLAFKKLKISRRILIASLSVFSLLSLFSLNYFKTKSPLRLVYFYLEYLNERDDFRNRLELRKFSAIDILENTSPDQNTVVFVLGESTPRSRMSAYGYERKTTPFIDDSSIIKFNNVISPHTHTYSSLRKVLTLMNHDNQYSLKENVHIISLAEAAGYKTYWISNQKSLGRYENSQSIVAKNASEIYWLNDSVGTSVEQYDEEAVEVLKRVIQKKPLKKFVVIHLLGTHAKYRYRYPSTFKKFDDVFKTALPLNPRQQKTYNEFDNSILYQDHVLKELLNTLKANKGSYSFIYFPDHGEEVFQDEHLSGHVELNPSRNMYEIPMFFESSSTELNKLAHIHQAKLWSTEDFIHPLHTLLGVKTKYYENSRDLLTSEYKEIPRKVGKKEYSAKSPDSKH